MRDTIIGLLRWLNNTANGLEFDLNNISLSDEEKAPMREQLAIVEEWIEETEEDLYRYEMVRNAFR